MNGGSARWRRPALDAGVVLAAGALAAGVLLANPPRPSSTSTPRSVAQALRLLRADPLRVDALRDLGLALDRGGDRADSQALLAFAGERSKRDTATSLWLLQRALEDGRYDQALAQADALLRRDIEPERRERLYTLLTAAAAYDRARPALVERLAGRPWWRESFLRDLASKGDPGAGEAVLTALQAARAGPSPEESQAFVVRLISDGRFAAAVQANARLFGSAASDPDNLATPPPVGWSPAQGEGATSAADDGRLAVTYDGFASPALPRRLLALAPGTWRITFQHRTPDGAPPRLKIAARCAEGAPLGETAPLAATPTWRSETFGFTVPPTACTGQWLAILTVPGERRSPVETDFAGWTVARP